MNIKLPEATIHEYFIYLYNGPAFFIYYEKTSTVKHTTIIVAMSNIVQKFSSKRGGYSDETV